MPNPLVSKLSHGASLSEADVARLTEISAPMAKVPPHTDLIREGDRPDKVQLVMSGIACRYKILPDGGRQIMAFLLPGDICDLHVTLLGHMDHSIATVSACDVVAIPRDTILELTNHHPAITRALWWSTLVDEAILREWLVGMGQRSAEKRLAHLFCEIFLRMQVAGMANGNSILFPLTQSELGDTLGLSVVHVNRMIQNLREDGLISLDRKVLEVHDMPGLMRAGGFDPNYLHLRKSEERGVLGAVS